MKRYTVVIVLLTVAFFSMVFQYHYWNLEQALTVPGIPFIQKDRGYTSVCITSGIGRVLPPFVVPK